MKLCEAPPGNRLALKVGLPLNSRAWIRLAMGIADLTNGYASLNTEA